MAEHARRQGPAKKAKAPGPTAAGKLLKGAGSGRVRERCPAKPEPLAEANASGHLPRLQSLAEKADRGEAVDTTGMTGEDFLKAFLGR